MTEYRVIGATTEDSAIVLQLRVGKRDRLEPIPLDRPQAWRLFRELARLLETTEGVSR